MWASKSRRKPCIPSIPLGIAYHQLHKKLYIINAKHCISSSRQNTHLRCDDIRMYASPKARHTFDDMQPCGADDIPSLSAWIKKSCSFEQDFLAESQGFEPWVSFPTQHFECCTFDHSDNSPYSFYASNILPKFILFVKKNPSEGLTYLQFCIII